MKEKQYKIAVLSVHSSPLGQPGVGDTGGMSIYIRELTAELAKKGCQVDIFTRSQDPSTPEISELAPGVRLINLQAGEPADLDKLLIYSVAPDFACKMTNYCKDRNLQYDIIFSHYWISGISGLYLQAWWQVPHVIMFHTLGAIKNSIGIGEDEPELRIEEENLIARECQRIIASTENEKELLNRYYNVPQDKVSVIPCGVNLKHFQPTDKSQARKRLGLGDEKVILFVGRIERLKGIDRIIRALPHLRDIKSRLLIVGEDGNRMGETQNLKNLAESLGVAGSVTFAGLVEYEELQYYYNAADVCAFPSFYESFGLVPLESLACGTPVVATDVGDLRNIIREGQTGYVLGNNDQQVLAERLEAILTGKVETIKNPADIRDSIVRFGWKKIADAVVREFDKLLLKDKVKA